MMSSPVIRNSCWLLGKKSCLWSWLHQPFPLGSKLILISVVLSSQKVEEASGQSLGPTPQAPWKVMGQEPWDLLFASEAPGGGWMDGSLSMSILKPKLMN
jgi:hypothetical protein